MRAAVLVGWVALTGVSVADDWPQWMGPQRDGVYREAGVATEFPKSGLPIRWRKPIGPGYSGPAVADGRVYVTDRIPDSAKPPAPAAVKKDEPKSKEKGFPKTAEIERIVCLRADTGEQIWKREIETEYRLSYPEGPRATPTVADGKVYTLGAMGRLECLNAADGTPVWSRDFQKDYKAPNQAWGWAAHPFLDGNNLITLVGGKGSAVVAFDRNTGKEVWRALDSEEVGYAPPLLATIGGKRQLVVYTSDSLAGLDPVTGAKLWSTPYPVEGKPTRPATPIGMPAAIGNTVFVTSFYEGSLLVDLGPTGDRPKVVWNGANINRSEKTTGLHGLMTTPIHRDGYIYGLCAMGELRCLEPATGKRLWESLDLFGKKQALFGTAFLTPHANGWYLFADTGDFVSAELTAKGYVERSRTHLIDAVQPARGRRKVVWSHPAYADRAVFVRNHQEIVCASLAADDAAKSKKG